jgi:hypothetical protein
MSVTCGWAGYMDGGFQTSQGSPGRVSCVHQGRFFFFLVLVEVFQHKLVLPSDSKTFHSNDQRFGPHGLVL